MGARTSSRVAAERVDELYRGGTEPPPLLASRAQEPQFWRWIAAVIGAGGLAGALSVTLMTRVSPPGGQRANVEAAREAVASSPAEPHLHRRVQLARTGIATPGRR